MLDRTTTVRADSVEIAVQQGLAELKIEEKDAEIRVISEGKKGFLGFGKQEAVVHISAKYDDLSMRELTQQLEAEAGIKTPQKKTKITNKQSKTADYIRSNNQQEDLADDLEFSSQDAEEKELEGQSIDFSDTEAAVVAEEPSLDTSAEILSGQESAEPEMPEEIEEDAELPPAPATNVKPEPEPEVAEKNESATHEGNQKELTDSKRIETETEAEEIDYSVTRQAVCRYLEQVIQEYGAEAQVTYKTKGNQVIFNIETDKSGLVIGKHGKIINALQTLVQVMIHRTERRRTTILLNVGDYRDRRSNVLEQIAQRTADQVLKTKQTVILDPLPAYERKQIHAYLSKVDHVSTHSEGKDPNRYLVVDYVP